MLTLVSLPNLDQFSQPTFIPVLINQEIEALILDSHISLMGNECGLQFFDFQPTIEPKLTLESKLNFLESVLVLEPISFEPNYAKPLFFDVTPLNPNL